MRAGSNCRTVWVPLDDVDEDNGALRVLPGAHAGGEPAHLSRTGGG